MVSAICFKLDQYKIWSSDNGVIHNHKFCQHAGLNLWPAGFMFASLKYKLILQCAYCKKMAISHLHAGFEKIKIYIFQLFP